MIHNHAADQVAVVGSIDPDAYGTGTYTSGWVDAADFHSFMAVIQAGTLGSSATLDAKLEQAQDDSGTGAKDVSGSDITQLTQGGTDQSDDQAVISMLATELDTDNSFTHVRVSITVGTASSDASAVLLGVFPRSAPADDQDASTVGEVVRV